MCAQTATHANKKEQRAVEIIVLNGGVNELAVTGSID